MRPTSAPTRHFSKREAAWFFAALLVYAATRLIALDRFPIFFFCDEAINPVLAHDLAAHGFRAADGEWLPAYFRNFSKYCLSLSVYLHGLTSAVFGRSIETVRATSALASLLGAAAVAWLMQRVFRVREWWLLVLLLAATPVWLLFSRTGFEAGLMVSCYSGFLLFYGLYRYRNPRWILAAMVCGAATFYAYANGQGVMLVSATLLAISDARYHWRHRRWAAAGLALALVLFVPYIRFRLGHPEMMREYLQDLDSFFAKDLTLAQKAAIFLDHYAHGLGLRYWFFPDPKELIRHQVPGGYAHFLVGFLPLFLLGIARCLWHWRESRYRLVLIAALAAPFSAAAVAGITALRALEFVVPANIAILLGLDWVIARVRAPGAVLALRVGAFAALALAAGVILRDGLALGPTASREYGLYGLQWGAKELYRDTLPGWLQRYPQAHFHVSSGWANGVNVFPEFFHLSPERVTPLNLEAFAGGEQKVGAEDVVVALPEELPLLRASAFLAGCETLGTLRRPDGEAGFVFLRVRMAQDWDARHRAWELELARPVETTLSINGRPTRVTHPGFELGSIEALFDGKPETVARCYRAVPLVVELCFPEPRRLAEVVIFHREHCEFRQTVVGYDAQGEPVCEQQDRGNLAERDRVVRVPLGDRALERLRIEVALDGEESWVHLREIALVEAPR